MKNLLNNTILRDLQDWKVTNRETQAVLYLPTNRVQDFLKMNGGKLHNYKFETAAQRKTQRVVNILDYIVLSSALIGICLISYNLLAS